MVAFRSIALVFLLPGSLAFAWQDSPAKQELAGQVRRLVLLLDGNKLSLRERAEKELIQLGPEILSYLPDDSEVESDEVRQRLERIRITHQKKLSALVTQASQVDLAGQMTIQEALEQLARQTGNLVTSRQDEELFLFEYTQRPYWEALDGILDRGQLNLALARTANGQISTLARPPQQRSLSGQAFYKGVFRVEAVQVSSVRDLQNPELRSTRLTVDIRWEPRLQPIYLAIPLKSVGGATENGVRVLADDPEGLRTANVEGNVTAVRVQLPLASVARSESLLGQLQGTISTVIPGYRGTFSFADLTKADQQRRQGGVQVLLHSARAIDKECQVSFSVVYPPAARAFESHRGWIRNNPAWLTDAEGRRLKPSMLMMVGQSGNRIDFRCRFPFAGSLRDCTFSYQSPVLLAEQQIPFQLKEIPLP